MLQGYRGIILNMTKKPVHLKSAIDSFTKKVTDKKLWAEWWPLVLLGFIVTISFVYGWLLDPTTPRSGAGWADQTLYKSMVDTLRSGNMLNSAQLHYTIGYPLLGVIGSLFFPNDPFLVVSYLLLLSSLIFCYLGARNLLGKYWALLFCILLFTWDGVSRSLNFSQEVFNIPWNNQVLFFTFAFYFWLFITKSSKPASWRMAALVGLISGFAFLTREETILFVIPVTIVYFLISKTSLKKAVVAIALIIMCFLPQMIIKSQVVGSVTSSGRPNRSYSKIVELYSNPRRFVVNTRYTIFKSDYIGQRESLLEAAPWVLLSIPGAYFIIFRRKYPVGIKIFVVASFVYVVFYLMGDNMRPIALQFHNLRYISAAFIAMNFASIIAIRELSLIAEKQVKNHKNLQ